MQFKEAERRYCITLEIFEHPDVLGPDSPDVATVLVSLADVKHMQSDSVTASNLLLRAASIREEVFSFCLEDDTHALS